LTRERLSANLTLSVKPQEGQQVDAPDRNRMKLMTQGQLGVSCWEPLIVRRSLSTILSVVLVVLVLTSLLLVGG
jgi:hypothetical protein